MKKLSLSQVLFGVAIISIIGSIIPALLDAKSDVSILIGVLIVVALFYAVITYGKTFMRMIGIDFDKE